MKKTTALLSILLCTSLFAACSSKWQHEPDISEDMQVQYLEKIDEQMELLKEDPSNRDALFEVALRYHHLGDYKKAVTYYKKVLEQDENDWAALNNLADLYEDMEEYEKAAQYIKRLYAIDQESIEVIQDTVRILLEAGDALNARHALENFESLVMTGETPEPALTELIDSLYEDINAQEQKTNS